MIRAILACDGQGGIARNGVMPWPRNKTDLRHFQKLTSGCTVVMGKRTWEAEDMPTPLPNRNNVVVTSEIGYDAPGATVSNDIKADLTNLTKDNTVFVIGGANLFVQLIDEIDILYLTRITGHYDCDTFLPLATIDEKFECIDNVDIDKMTRYETYLARKLNDIPLRTKF